MFRIKHNFYCRAITPFLSALLICSLNFSGTTKLAAGTPGSGFFEGQELRPLGTADETVLEAPLAGVLIFRHDPASYDHLVQLDAWATQSLVYSVPVFAIIVAERDELADVIEEIVTQRRIKLPVFVTTAELLDEKEMYRLLVVRKNRAKKIDDFNLVTFGELIGRYVQEMGLAPLSDAARANKSADALTTRPQAKNPLYVNQRYQFRIRWPRGWDYKIARNGDGAVGVPPTGVSLEARVWAAPEIKSTDPTDPPAYVQINDYLKYVSTLAKGQVNIEKKLKVFDGDIEGRDYTYSYTRVPQADKPEQEYRGRIQAFVVDGVGKLVCVEGPTPEFDRNANMIDQFIYSFRPTLE